MFSVSGTILAMSLTRTSGIDSARLTSRIAAFALSVPNVPIWATFACAIFLLGVVDYQLPAVAAEVDVDIGRFGTARIEEPLEEQVIFERADVA